MFSATLSDTKSTDQHGGTDIFVAITDGTTSFTRGFHFDAPPAMSDVQAAVAPVLDQLNASDPVSAQLSLLNAAKGTAIQGAGSAPSLSKFAFRSLFTTPELLGIDNFGSNSSLTADQKAMLTTIIAGFNSADQIRLSDVPVQQGLGYLVMVGLLTQDRMTAILGVQ